MMILTESERERRFTPDEVRMAKVIGEQAAAALHNARLHRREEDQHRWLAALAAATRVIASQLDAAELLQDVARLAADALLIDRVVVYEVGARPRLDGVRRQGTIRPAGAPRPSPSPRQWRRRSMPARSSSFGAMSCSLRRPTPPPAWRPPASTPLCGCRFA